MLDKMLYNFVYKLHSSHILDLVNRFIGHSFHVFIKWTFRYTLSYFCGN